MFDLIADNKAAQLALAEASAAAGVDVVLAARAARQLFDNKVAQPLICAYQLAAWAALKPLLPPPHLFAGYSVGELAAYGCAGALSARDTVALARQRADFMDQETSGQAGLLAVRGLSERAITQLCADCGTEVAIVNGEQHCLVGGALASLSQFAALATRSGATVQQLKITVAAHTSSLVKAGDRFRLALENSTLSAPATAVLAGTSGQAVRQRSDVVATLSEQISRTVQWSQCLDAAYERGCRVFLELGPGNALTRMVRERFPQALARSVDDFRSLAGAAEWVARYLH